MSGDPCYLGCPFRVVESLKVMYYKLNAEVAEQVNDTQELVMLNNFARESNEYQFKKCLQERIADISSWQWVLRDLNKRLGEAIDTLQYEDNAIQVVIDRIKEELHLRCEAATKPGALTPMCDGVEDAIMQECDFLRAQRKKFEDLTSVLKTQTTELKKTMKKIDDDIWIKQQALTIEESCAKITLETPPVVDTRRKPKKKDVPVDQSCWENRCSSLKRAGLRALTSAVIIRQQVRAARVQLSISAQSFSARVDSALRRRLHVNKVKLQDLNWDKDEALRDYTALGEELTATEQNVLETMEQERVISARLVDRGLRPVGELTRDEVDRKLRDELGRLRNFLRHLRNNHCRITTLQAHLVDCITRIDCCIEDIMRVVRIDEDRIRNRLCEEASPTTLSSADGNGGRNGDSPPRDLNENLHTINEEDEPLETSVGENLQSIFEKQEDGLSSYPFDD